MKNPTPSRFILLFQDLQLALRFGFGLFAVLWLHGAIVLGIFLPSFMHIVYGAALALVIFVATKLPMKLVLALFLLGMLLVSFITQH